MFFPSHPAHSKRERGDDATTASPHPIAGHATHRQPRATRDPLSRGFGSSSLLHEFSRHLYGLQGRIQRPSTIAGWLPALKPDRASAGAHAWGSAPYTPRRLASASSTGAHGFDGAARRATQRRYRRATYPNGHRLTQTAGGSRPQRPDWPRSADPLLVHQAKCPGHFNGTRD